MLANPQIVISYSHEKVLPTLVVRLDQKGFSTVDGAGDIQVGWISEYIKSRCHKKKQVGVFLRLL